MRTRAAAVVLGAAMAANGQTDERNFGQDVEFLRAHTETVVLGSSEGARIAVAPSWQGRVMTSTAAGDEGDSYGWIYYDFIESGAVDEHMNVYGGEERLWMGPEGGQYGLFFKKGDPFDFEHWRTPAVIDTEAYAVTAQDASSVSFSKTTRLENWSGTVFDVRIDRTVRLLDSPAVKAILGVEPGAGVKTVAYESENTLTNTGHAAWEKDGGLLSIWILCMFKPGSATTVAIPFERGAESERGRVVNDEYFGKIGADRLKVAEGMIYFRGDGRERGKIGLSPSRATPVAGSYDAAKGLLTIAHYNKPAEARDYVNSMWAMQENPYGGDVINSYNDGPTTPGGKPLGPFYELETSSPAAALRPGETITHFNRIFHFQGSSAELDPLARTILGVGLAEIEGAFGG